MNVDLILAVICSTLAVLTVLYALLIERRARKWNRRRERVLAERRARDDYSYGDHLAKARVLMRG